MNTQETPEQENARVRAEVMAEMDNEEAGVNLSVDASPQAEEAAKTVVDPWEGVSPALKEMFDAMTSKVGELETTQVRLQQAEKRIGAITNELHKATKAVEKTTATPTAEQVQAAAVDDEKWETLKKDYPEWAEAFDTRFDKKLNVKVHELREELKSELANGGGEKTVENIDERLLNILKPGWKDTVKTNDWKAWLSTQAPERRALVQSDRAEDAISLLTDFEKQATAPQKTASEIAAERRNRLKTSEVPRGGKSVPVKSEADMSPEELRANIGREVYAE